MSFLDGFEDELTKLAQTPYGGRPPEISRRKATAGSFDWQGFDKKFKSESAAARRREDYKAKGGLSLLPPKPNPYKHKPPPSDAQEEVKKKGGGRGKSKPPPPPKVKYRQDAYGTDENKLEVKGGTTRGRMYQDQYGKRSPIKLPGVTGGGAVSAVSRAAYPANAKLPWGSNKQKKTVKPTSAPTTQGEQTYLP
jgi:hypothetical protein